MTPRALLPAPRSPCRRVGSAPAHAAGRAIVIGLAIKVVIALLARVTGPLPSFLRVVDTVPDSPRPPARPSSSSA
jgi:hypothetical protein